MERLADQIGGNDRAVDMGTIKCDGVELLDSNFEEVKVISTGYPDSNTMVVDGGNWDTSNQSQVWSNFLSVSDGELTNKYAPFDGDTSTQTAGTVGGSDIYLLLQV